MIYPIGGCSTHPIIHVAVADVDAAYGAYAAAEHNTFNNTNNSNNTAYNNANNNANNDGKTRYLKQHRKPPGENHTSESSTNGVQGDVQVAWRLRAPGPRAPQKAILASKRE